jgi:hypothetical protein
MSKVQKAGQQASKILQVASKNISESDPKAFEMEDGELNGTHVIATDQHAAVLTKSGIGACDLPNVVFNVAILAHSRISSSYRSSDKERSAASGQG